MNYLKRIIIFLMLTILTFSSLSSKTLYDKNILIKVEQKYGKSALNRFLLLKRIINNVSNLSDMEKLEEINKFFNNIMCTIDIEKSIPWATPFELLAKNKGSSEDFAIAKYITLVNELNLKNNNFHFVYVKSKIRDVSYMVLAYYKTKNSKPYVLDPFNKRILKIDNRKDIKFLISFDMGNLKNKDIEFFESLKFDKLLKDIKEGKI